MATPKTAVTHQKLDCQGSHSMEAVLMMCHEQASFKKSPSRLALVPCDKGVAIMHTDQTSCSRMPLSFGLSELSSAPLCSFILQAASYLLLSQNRLNSATGLVALSEDAVPTSREAAAMPSR